MPTEQPWPAVLVPVPCSNEQPSGCSFSGELSLLGASAPLFGSNPSQSLSLSLGWGRSLPWGIYMPDNIAFVNASAGSGKVPNYGDPFRVKLKPLQMPPQS